MTTLIDTARDATWRERAATWAMFLALGVEVGAWAAALPALKAGLDLSDRDLSLALLAISVGAVLSGTAAGLAVPRFGTGRGTAAGAVAVILAYGLPALAGSLPQLVACAFAMGLAGGVLEIAVNGHASDVERRWGGPLMSSFHGAFSLGGLFGAGVGGLLAPLGVAGQLCLPLAGGGLLVLLAIPALGPGARTVRLGGGRLAWPERALLGLCAVVLFCFMIEGAMADWSAVYLATVTGAAAGPAAAGYAAFSVAMTLGRTFGDGAVRRLGPRRIVLWGGALAFAGLGLAVAVPSTGPATLGFALVGVGAANIVPVVFSAAARFGSSPSAGVAVVTTVGYAGFLGGPPLIGAVATAAGLRVGLAVLLLAAVLVAAGSRQVERPVPPAA